MNTSLDLNPGGEIYDIEYLEEINYWVVVGDFNTVNGVSRDNIFCLDGNFNLVTTPNLNTNGPIYSVESYHYIPGLGVTNIYIAGEFTEANSVTHWGAAMFEWLDAGGVIFGNPTLSTWDPDFDSWICFDVEEYSNRIIYTGDFTEVNSSTTQDLRMRIAGFWADDGADYATIDDYDSYSTNYCWNFEVLGGWMYLAANESHLIKMNPGVTAGMVNPPGAIKTTEIYDLDDSLFLIGVDPDAGGWNGMTVIEVRRKSDLSIKNDHAYSNLALVTGTPFSIRTYDEYLFTASNWDVYRFKPEDINLVSGTPSDMTLPMTTTNIFSLNHEENSVLGVGSLKSNLIIENNILATSFSNLASASGFSRAGVAYYCLPPKNPDWFTTFDSIICQFDTVDFAFPASEFAEGYKWEFSNNTVDLDITDSPVQTVLTTTVPSLSVETLENFVSGTLTVTPYSTCNNTIIAGDTSFAKSISINLGLDYLPNALAGQDTLLTCYFPSIDLIGNSDTANVSYSWKELGTPSFTPGQTFTVSDSAEYVLAVENQIGCWNFDTVLVDIDTIKPTFDTIIGPFDITCIDTLLALTGTVNNTTDTLTWWTGPTPTDTTWNNPIIVSQPGTFKFHAQDTYNGCIDSMNYPIITQLNEDKPDLFVLGYPDTALYTYIDTVNCYNPILNLTGSTTAADADIFWVSDTLSTTSLGNLASVSSDTLMYLYAEDSINGCFDYQSIQIFGNFAIPTDTIYPHSSLNCSNDSLHLIGGTSWLNTTSVWTGPGIAPTNDSVWINSTGYFTLTTTWSTNGCSSIDSTLIVSDNTIDVFVSNDTTVCDQSPAMVNATYSGNIAGITYLWSNGETNSSATFTGGTDSIAIVEISGSGGCYGTDTIFIGTPPTPIINFQGFAPCAAGQGSITATPVSGWGPFQYSIDNGLNFQTSTTFTGLNEGSHNILVQDSLGCNHPFTATIDQNSQTVQADFLVTTYNYQSDTAIAINVSALAADSTIWFLSPGLILIEETLDSVKFIMPDTGFFEIGLEAYFGSCSNYTSKTIHVSDLNSSIPDPSQDLGIKSVNIYPNPNNGIFTVEVELFQSQDVAIRLYDMIGNQYITPLLDYYDQLMITENINVTISAADAGVYYLVIVSEHDVQTFNVTITP